MQMNYYEELWVDWVYCFYETRGQDNKATTHHRSGGGLNSSSGGELNLYLKWKRNTGCTVSHKKQLFKGNWRLSDVACLYGNELSKNSDNIFNYQFIIIFSITNSIKRSSLTDDSSLCSDGDVAALGTRPPVVPQ